MVVSVNSALANDIGVTQNACELTGTRSNAAVASMYVLNTAVESWL